MILSVREQFHDHEAKNYFIDTDKLDPENHIDAQILKKCERISSKKVAQINLSIEATDWDTDPAFKGKEPRVTPKAIFKKSKEIDAILNLEIFFDC